MPLIRALDPLDMAGVTPVTPSTLAAEDAAQAQGQIAQLKLTQEQNAQRRQDAFRASLAQLGKSPSSTAYTQLMMQYPEFAEGMSPILKQMGSQEAAAEASTFQGQALPAYHAFLNKRPDLAASHLDDLARAYANAGNASKAQQIAGLAKAARENPDVASGTLGAMLAGSMGHENYDAMLKGAGFLKQQEKVEKEIGKLGTEATKLQRETLSEAEVADRGLKATAEREDAQTQARLRGGLMGSEIAQNNASAAASTAQAGLAGAQTARVNEQRPAELRALEADATSKAAAAAEATRLERARADKAVADAAAAGAVPPALLRRQAEAKAKEDEARAEYARIRYGAEASSAESKATMDKFNLANAQPDLVRRRQREELEIEKAKQELDPVLRETRLKQAQANLQKTETEIINSVQEQNRAWEQLKLKQADAVREDKRLDADLGRIKAEYMKLPPEAIKSNDQTMKETVDARNAIGITDDLVRRVDTHLNTFGPTGGAAGWFNDLFTRASGGAFGIGVGAKETRTKYLNFLNQEILKNIPPGSLTEKERAIVASGFPSEQASPYEIKSFLMAVRAASEAKIRVNKAQMEWRSKNGGDMGAAREPLVINGQKVAAGVLFDDLIEQQELMQRKARESQ